MDNEYTFFPNSILQAQTALIIASHEGSREVKKKDIVNTLRVLRGTNSRFNWLFKSWTANAVGCGDIGWCGDSYDQKPLKIAYHHMWYLRQPLWYRTRRGRYDLTRAGVEFVAAVKFAKKHL